MINNFSNNAIERTVQGMDSWIEGVIQLSNGKEVIISLGNKRTSFSYHHLENLRIECNEENEVSDIKLWTKTSKGAIDLKTNDPQLFKNEGKLRNIKVVETGFLQPVLNDENFLEFELEEINSESQIFKFESRMETKVIVGGELEFPPLD